MMFNFGKPYDWRFSQMLFSELIKTKPDKILDVGCGSGEKSLLFAKKGKNFVGLDFSVGEVRKAKSKGIKAIVGNAEKLPFSKNQFNVVLSFHLIEHLNNPLAFLNECYRVLAPGGYLILVTPNRNRWTSMVTKHVFINSKYKYPMNHDHIFEFSKNDMMNLFSKTKFKKSQIIPLFFGIKGSVVHTPFNIGFLHPPSFLTKWCDQYAVWAKK